MSRPRTWHPWAEGFPSTAKQPPPEDGIKLGKVGRSWWGKLWIEALERALGAGAGRLSRGRSYARAGRTHDLTVTAGRVSASVTGSRIEPYRVVIALRPLDAAAWQRVIAKMALKAQFTAELLDGRMPRGLDELFAEAGVSLFPAGRADLKTSCTCPDWGDPCKHVAATHYVLGEAFDRDPFLLFELRGRRKEQVLTALREARTATKATVEAPAVRPHRGAAPTKIEADGAIETAARPKRNNEKSRPRLPSKAEYDAPRVALPPLQFSFAAPKTRSAALRQLGAPAHWVDKLSPAESLGSVIHAAAEKARRIALADLPLEAKAERPPSRRPSRLEPTRAKAAKKRGKPESG